MVNNSILVCLSCFHKKTASQNRKKIYSIYRNENNEKTCLRLLNKQILKEGNRVSIGT